VTSRVTPTTGAGRPRSALAELTLARLRLFLREPSALFWTFGFPVVLAVALGIAFRNKPPDPVHVAIVEGPRAEATRAAFDAKEVIARVEDEPTARAELRAGKVALVVTPGVPRTYRYDVTRPESRIARLLVDDRLQRADGRLDPTRTAEENVTEPGSRYIDFLVPGLVGLTLMSSSMWGIGYLIVEMRTRKLVKRMLATPMRKSDFLLSFVFMRALFVLLEVPVLFGFGWIAFGVRVTGSAGALMVVSLLGAFAFAGIGLLVASRAQNTQTVGGLMNLVMMPMFVGSGVFFSASNFPDALQPFLRALPLTALNDALRAVVNEGAGLPAIGSQMALLVGYAVVTMVAALRLFRWQ
jgi:ABC-2 type transport system permease protein